MTDTDKNIKTVVVDETKDTVVSGTRFNESRS